MTQHEKCPNTDFFLVRIFLIRTEYGPEKTPYMDTFHAVRIIQTCTAKNPVISPNFLVWKFYGKVRFPHIFGRFARNYAKIVPFHKITTPEN